MSAKEILYEKHRKNMKDGDILLFKGHGVYSDIIKWKTKSEYTHAGIVAWWNNRLMVLEAVGKGVIASPISYNLKHYHGSFDYYRLKKNVKITDATRKKMVSFAQEQLGKEYNVRQIVIFFLKLLIGARLKKADKSGAVNQYFCSHYVADIYSEHGYDLAVALSDQYTSPDNIKNSDKLEFVGTLKK